jgi:hypothetical protein|tara:strand:- start:97 stop:324 length:228 start_codon:yes stop_codon:yes gene_type:complete
MKSYAEIKKKLGSLSDSDKQKIQELQKELKSFNERGNISVEGLKTLFNIQTKVSVLIEQYNDKILNLLKQNHMVD